ncbi:hypothetical protein AAVH_11296 [Aphelenchoides avenae]|nr:hypothetical protein AAVH_11296 [Aphelenchus avenae]
MRRNFWAEADEDSDSDEWSNDDEEEASDAANKSDEALAKASPRRGRSLSPSRLPPKNFDNSIFETALTRGDFKAMSKSQPELYDPQEAFEWIVPVLALANEHGVRVALV